MPRPAGVPVHVPRNPRRMEKLEKRPADGRHVFGRTNTFRARVSGLSVQFGRSDAHYPRESDGCFWLGTVGSPLARRAYAEGIRFAHANPAARVRCSAVRTGGGRDKSLSIDASGDRAYPMIFPCTNLGHPRRLGISGPLAGWDGPKWHTIGRELREIAVKIDRGMSPNVPEKRIFPAMKSAPRGMFHRQKPAISRPEMTQNVTQRDGRGWGRCPTANAPSSAGDAPQRPRPAIPVRHGRYGMMPGNSASSMPGGGSGDRVPGYARVNAPATSPAPASLTPGRTGLEAGCVAGLTRRAIAV